MTQEDRPAKPTPLPDGTVPKVLEGQLTVEDVLAESETERKIGEALGVRPRKPSVAEVVRRKMKEDR
jgi:hypothetical protein